MKFKLLNYWTAAALLHISACAAALPITGSYKYESDAGATVAQEATSVTYSLDVSTDKCTLVASGFQTDEKIRCVAVEQAGSTLIQFVSYDNGSTLNAYGVEVYKKNGTLFSLQNKGKVLATTWKLMMPDGVRKPTGVYFKAAS
ncbi:MAG TPA: DUF5991 domain-containing protein [Cellvibrionaceae bacterium]